MMKRICIAVVVVSGICVSPAQAQIPQKFTNLRVLPVDIPRDSLRSLMRTVAGSLGVQCSYCHTGGDPVTLIGVDWASDAKETKRRAREMFEMVALVNEQLDASRIARSDPIRVDCATCHRGLPRPEPLQAVLMRTLSRSGVDSAVAQYRELRGRLLTRGRYDFGEASLNILADQLVAQGKDRDAIRMLELNREFNPEAPTMSIQLADLYRKVGERERARELYAFALTKQPRNFSARLKLSDVTCTRTVEGHTLTSLNAPAVKIELDSVMEYVGCQSYVIKGNARVERYHFADTDDKAVLRRLLVVHLEEAFPSSSVTYSESIPRERRSTGFLFSASPVAVGKHRYIHNVRFYDNTAAIAANPDAESSRTMQYLAEIGVTVPNEIAWSRFMRPLPGARSEVLFFYFEPIAASGFTLADFRPGGRGDAGLERTAAAVLSRSLKPFRIVSED